jgi:regulator of RNase E activity RraA
MIDALHAYLSGPAFAMTMLACGTLVVVVEAVHASRRALWGDLFAEDCEE